MPRARSSASPPRAAAAATARSCACARSSGSPAICRSRCRSSPPAFRRSTRRRCSPMPAAGRGRRGRRRRRAGRRSLVLHPRSRHVLAAGEDRGRAAARRGARARARRRELGRRRSQPLITRFRLRPRSTGLCAGGTARSLCRLRAAHRAGKRHPAAEDHHAGDRRQCLERTHHRAQERRFRLHGPARSRRDAGRDQGDHRGVRRTRHGHRPEGRPQAARPARARRRRPSGCSRCA